MIADRITHEYLARRFVFTAHRKEFFRGNQYNIIATLYCILKFKNNNIIGSHIITVVIAIIETNQT